MSNIVTTQADELRAFFARVRPCYRELFNMAHAICGNYELAEYAVQSAILDVFRRGSPRSRAGPARGPCAPRRAPWPWSRPASSTMPN